MEGNLANARVWVFADVWIGTDASGPVTDVTTDLAGLGYEPVGIIDEDAGVDEEFSESSTKHYAHGGFLVRETSTKHDRTIKFTALEDTDLVFHLANPGSISETVGPLTTREVRPRNGGLAIRPVCAHLTDGEIVKRLYMPRLQLKWTGTKPTNDNDITHHEFTGSMYAASGDNGIWLMREFTNDPGAAVLASA